MLLDVLSTAMVVQEMLEIGHEVLDSLDVPPKLRRQVLSFYNLNDGRTDGCAD